VATRFARHGRPVEDSPPEGRAFGTSIPRGGVGSHLHIRPCFFAECKAFRRKIADHEGLLRPQEISVLGFEIAGEVSVSIAAFSFASCQRAPSV
jgi:hypothetical protein